MGKVGFSPIIGLAVVVALALAAVFGSMSLANPVHAEADIEDLAVAAAGQTTGETTFEVTLQWKPIANHDADDYQLRWRESGDNFGPWEGSEDTGIDDAVVGTISPGTVAVAATGDADAIPEVLATVEITVLNEASYDIQIRTTPGGVGDPEEVTVDLANIPEQADDLETDVDGSSVELTWDDPGDENITGWQYTMVSTAPSPLTEVAAAQKWMDIPGSDAETESHTVTGVGNGTHYFAVRAVNGDTPGLPATIEDSTTDVYAMAPVTEATAVDEESGLGPRTDDLPMFMADSKDPGSNTRYTVKFDVRKPVNTLIHDLVIEFHEDYSVPSSISTSAVTITTGYYLVDEMGVPTTVVGHSCGQQGDDAGDVMVATGATEDDTVDCATFTFNPRDVSVDGEEIFISIGDITEDDDEGVYSVGGSGVTMEVVFRQAAGISNPTENGGYFLVAIGFDDAVEDEYDEDAEMPEGLEENVPLKLTLDEEDGGLGTVVTATGKGYKNGTTLTVFRDKLQTVMWDHDDDEDTDMVALDPDDKEDYMMTTGALWLPDDDVEDSDGNLMAPNRNLDQGEDVLCVVARIDGDDQGSCEFTVTHPTFGGGLNYVNAVDGRDNYDDSPDTFLLEQSIQASPAEGSPGEIILIQMVDFPRGASVDRLRLGRLEYCGSRATPTGEIESCPAATVDSTGSANFSITIPNWARAGVQDLRVDAGGVGAGTNVTIGGPVIMSTPGEVLANQRISLVGTGFSSNAVIGDDDLLEGSDSVNDLSKISIGGDVIRRGRINGGDDVEVDSGGNWSASVDLPLAAATTADGERAIRVTDSGGRTGVVMVTVPTRTVTITPEAGRVGTIAVIRGTGFPSKNDEGSSFNVQIVYDAGNDKETTVSAVPDASGRFEVQLRVPTTASIPSTNTVRVEFEDDENVAVVTTVAHEVPEGIINLSETSGGPGSTVTVNGEGFKSFVPIALVRVGALDVTPSPKPSTDGNGMMSFDITVPGLDVGIQTIEVSVGDTTASTGFTVTESGVNPGDIKAVAAGLEELGENLDVIWHFNNDTKDWTFWDGEEGSTLTHVITGETYLILVKSTVEVILNNDTRNLTCANGNCWNQLVW